MEKILIASQDGIIALDIEHLLKRNGYTTFHINNKSEVINTINRNKPDLAIINLDEAGRAEVKRYTIEISKNNNIPIIFLTTLPESYRKEISLDNKYVFGSIPFSEHELINNVNSLLKK